MEMKNMGKVRSPTQKEWSGIEKADAQRKGCIL